MKKFLLGILVGLLLCGMAGVIFFFASIRFTDRKPEIPKAATLVLKLEGEIPELAPMEVPFFGMDRLAPLTVAELWSVLRTAANDPEIRALLLEPRALAVGWGKLDELRAGLDRFP